MKIYIVLAVVAFLGSVQAADGDQICVPNSTYKEDCNSCICSADGKTSACTLKGCPVQAEAVCKPGDTKMDDCNHCRCIPDGIGWACTRQLCVHHNRVRKSIAKRSPQSDKCTPGSSWMEDCNQCHCTETGIAACTLKGCLGRSRSHPKPEPDTPVIRTIKEDEFRSADFSCQPGEHFKVECNNCKCAADGKKARCSKKRCIPGDDE